AHTLMGGLEQCYVGTIDLAPKIGARKNELKASGKYTDAGVAEQLIPEALAAVKPLRRAQNLIARAKQEVSERRARLKLKPPDRKDAAAELGRQEIRTWLRSLSQAERDRMFNGGGERVDPAIAEAVLSAPPWSVLRPASAAIGVSCGKAREAAKLLRPYNRLEDHSRYLRQARVRPFTRQRELTGTLI